MYEGLGADETVEPRPSEDVKHENLVPNELTDKGQITTIKRQYSWLFEL